MSNDDDLAQLEERLGYHFRDRAHLIRALTHRTWVEERVPGGRAPAHESQQRLEFLGDALLGYVVGRWLFELLPTGDVGELTARRTEFTKGKWLAAKGGALGLERLVRRGAGEAANQTNQRLLEDTVEAILGAILVDGGENAAVGVIRSWLPQELPSGLPLSPSRDPIVVFGEWFQKHSRSTATEPAYSSTGAQHTPSWRASREIDGIEYEGFGGNKQEAKRALCLVILEALGVPL